MKTKKAKMMSLLGLLVMALTAAHGSQSEQPRMNGKLRVTTLSPDEVRYTGKPYSKELGAYVFNCRNYDPQCSRWTTPDPSGFPDGANNQAYAPCPTWEVDPSGLLSVNGQTTPNLATDQYTVLTIAGNPTYTVTATTASQIDGNSFGMSFKGYTFASSTYSGSLNISTYTAFAKADGGGVSINVGITGDTQYNHWIQVATTSDPANGRVSGSPFIDNGSATNSSPYYDTYGAADAGNFYDKPTRPLSEAAPYLNWAANLYYVHDNGLNQDGTTSVLVYGGFSYSWTMSE